jgi:hypothetical protein
MATAVAMDDCVVLKLDRVSMARLLHEHADRRAISGACALAKRSD